MDKCCGNCEFYKNHTYCDHKKYGRVIVPTFTICSEYVERTVDSQVVEFVETHKDDILKLLAKEMELIPKKKKHSPTVWIHSVSTAGGIWDKYDCSNCGFRTGHTTDYCSNCGAKMEGYDYDTKRKNSR